MCTRKKLAFLLGLVVVTAVSACDNTDNPPRASVNYAEGTVSGGRFHQFDDRFGSPGEEIAVVIHTPIDDMSVIKSTLKVSYIFNERTQDAMTAPSVESALTAPLPSALDHSDSTESFWFPIPGSAELENCDWIHYRWSFQYTRPGSSDQVTFIGETRLIRVFEPTVFFDEAGDSHTRTDEECEAVP